MLYVTLKSIMTFGSNLFATIRFVPMWLYIYNHKRLILIANRNSIVSFGDNLLLRSIISRYFQDTMNDLMKNM